MLDLALGFMLLVGILTASGLIVLVGTYWGLCLWNFIKNELQDIKNGRYLY